MVTSMRELALDCSPDRQPSAVGTAMLGSRVRKRAARAAPLIAPVLAGVLAWPSAVTAQQAIRVESGVTASGQATERWLEVLRRRLSHGEYTAVAGVRKPLSSDEAAWARLIRSRVPTWQREIGSVAAPYRPTSGPDTAVVVLGNRGASDAFTHDARTIGFDLAMLGSEYGQADRPEQEDLIDRLFRHEYAHLLQKAWLSAHPYVADSPLRRALQDIWLEGLGNYHSLSARWRTVGSTPTPAAAEALAVLAPRLVARLAALACAGPGDEASLTADLSSGRFDRKWGALPAALWLDAESALDPDALRAFVASGPDGVWGLAERHLPERLGAVLRETRTLGSLCRGDGAAQ